MLPPTQSRILLFLCAPAAATPAPGLPVAALRGSRDGDTTYTWSGGDHQVKRHTKALVRSRHSTYGHRDYPQPQDEAEGSKNQTAASDIVEDPE